MSRRPFLVVSVLVLVGAACSSSGDDVADTTSAPRTTPVVTTPQPAPSTTAKPTPTVAPTTTAAPTTTVKPTTTPAPTTTLADTTSESSVLASRIQAPEGYEYADFDPEVVDETVRRINEASSLQERFSSVSRHLVIEEGHYLGSLDLFQLRDPDTSAEEVAQVMLIDVYGFGENSFWANITETEGDVGIVRSESLRFLVWTWVHDGIAYVTVYDGTAGNDAHGTDFVHAYAATLQDLPVPPETAEGPPPGPAVDVEDDHLVSHLLPVEGFVYRDVAMDAMVDFYNLFGEPSALQRASAHQITSLDRLAADAPTANVGLLYIYELDDELKGDEETSYGALGALARMDASDEPVFTPTQIGGELVIVAGYTRDDGSFGEQFLFEHDGLLYVIWAAPECSDPDVPGNCNEIIVEFMAKFVAATAQT